MIELLFVLVMEIIWFGFIFAILNGKEEECLAFNKEKEVSA